MKITIHGIPFHVFYVEVVILLPKFSFIGLTKFVHLVHPDYRYLGSPVYKVSRIYTGFEEMSHPEAKSPFAKLYCVYN